MTKKLLSKGAADLLAKLARILGQHSADELDELNKFISNSSGIKMLADLNLAIRDARPRASLISKAAKALGGNNSDDLRESLVRRISEILHGVNVTEAARIIRAIGVNLPHGPFRNKANIINLTRQISLEMEPAEISLILKSLANGNQTPSSLRDWSNIIAKSDSVRQEDWGDRQAEIPDGKK